MQEVWRPHEALRYLASMPVTTLVLKVVLTTAAMLDFFLWLLGFSKFGTDFMFSCHGGGKFVARYHLQDNNCKILR